MLFMQREKLFKHLVSFQFLHTPSKNKSILNLYQKLLLGYFSEDIKMWPSHNVLIGKPVTGCFTTYVM